MKAQEEKVEKVKEVKKVLVADIFDAEAVQEYVFKIYDQDVAIRIKPISDDRYIKIFEDIGEKSESEKNLRKVYEAFVSVGEEVIEQYAELDLEIEQVIEVINRYQFIAAKSVTKNAENIIVQTECWFDKLVVSQTHTLRKKTINDSIEYSGISAREYVSKPTSSMKDSVTYTYVDQHKAKAELYDSMILKVEGFKNAIVPIRFKAGIMDRLFGKSISPKK
jgi:hypothetical protein